jgi:hypothetical protein
MATALRPRASASVHWFDASRPDHHTFTVSTVPLAARVDAIRGCAAAVGKCAARRRSKVDLHCSKHCGVTRDLSDGPDLSQIEPTSSWLRQIEEFQGQSWGALGFAIALAASNRSAFVLCSATQAPEDQVCQWLHVDGRFLSRVCPVSHVTRSWPCVC